MAVTGAFKGRRGKRRAAPRSWSPDAGDDRKLVLHVGCGPVGATALLPRYQAPQWREVRLDIDPDVAPDVIASITDLSVIPDGSVDAVFSSHNLEHVYAYEVPIVLREFRRVLRSGGEVTIGVPDLEFAAHQIARHGLEGAAYVSSEGPITPLDMLYGYGKAVESGNEFMAHRTGFTAQTLKRKLHAAGFATVDVQRIRDALWAGAR